MAFKGWGNTVNGGGRFHYRRSVSLRGHSPLWGRDPVIELVAHVQDQVPKIAAGLNGRGVAAIAVRDSTGDAQSARFGTKGADFVLAR